MHRDPDAASEDAVIAATEKRHDLTVITRNVPEFERFQVPLLNPFENA